MVFLHASESVSLLQCDSSAMRIQTYPNVPITLVETWVLLSEVNFASPKSATYIIHYNKLNDLDIQGRKPYKFLQGYYGNKSTTVLNLPNIPTKKLHSHNFKQYWSFLTYIELITCEM
jgi:hypothetical protein